MRVLPSVGDLLALITYSKGAPFYNAFTPAIRIVFVWVTVSCERWSTRSKLCNYLTANGRSSSMARFMVLASTATMQTLLHRSYARKEKMRTSVGQQTDDR